MRKLLAVVLTIVAVLAAGWLALRRPDVPYDTLESAYSLPNSRFETIDNVKIHFTDAGPRDAPAVILVHGFAASVHTWTYWQDVLDETYRVISVDLPGHGLSRVPETEPVSRDYYVEIVDGLADELDLERFAIAGSSMGGGVAWNYALAHPDRVEALVLVDASGWQASAEDSESTPFIFKLLRIPVMRMLIRDLDLSKLVEDGLKDSFSDPSFVTPQMIERYSALSRAPGHRDALLAISADRSKEDAASREKLGAIRAPTLILWGDEDNLIPVALARKFEAAIPNAVAIIYEGVGHIPQEERAAESAGDVKAFLDAELAAIHSAPDDGDIDTSGGSPAEIVNTIAPDG
ncbi:MAG: alpha/beta fold hydrolase [Henriciella sp.]|uniref:alpha/beta fold hydrolase n=1 Tax=Henriciella sp. TaxID=1968823 RepID=UPI003C71F5A7